MPSNLAPSARGGVAAKTGRAVLPTGNKKDCDTMKRHQTTCAAPGFGASATTSEGRTVATPTRHFPGTGKFQKCDLYGKVFPNSDAAFRAMAERGYCEPYFSRTSVPSPLFAKLAHVRQQCRFDALYRLYKHQGGCGACRLKLYRKLEIMAARVGIFHAVAKNWGRKFRNGRQVEA